VRFGFFETKPCKKRSGSKEPEPQKSKKGKSKRRENHEKDLRVSTGQLRGSRRGKKEDGGSGPGVLEGGQKPRNWGNCVGKSMGSRGAGQKERTQCGTRLIGGV